MQKAGHRLRVVKPDMIAAVIVPEWRGRIFMKLIACAILAVSVYVALLPDTRSQTAGATSLPVPRIFQPPQTEVCIQLKTNDEPLLIRRTVSSNLSLRVLWLNNGQPMTNYSEITNVVISVTTNAP